MESRCRLQISNICRSLFWCFVVSPGDITSNQRNKMLLKYCSTETLVSFYSTGGQPCAREFPLQRLRGKACRHLALKLRFAGCLLEKDLGSDGKAGRASNCQRCVILTTQTRCLITGRNTHTHTDSQCTKSAALCYYLPQTEDQTNNSYQREKGRGGNGEKKEREKRWEESEKTRSWRLMIHSNLSSESIL